MANIQKYKKKHNYLWHGWRNDAETHFGVSYGTIGKWFEVAKPSLMEWIDEQLKIREVNQERAMKIKNKITASAI